MSFNWRINNQKNPFHQPAKGMIFNPGLFLFSDLVFFRKNQILSVFHYKFFCNGCSVFQHANQINSVRKVAGIYCCFLFISIVFRKLQIHSNSKLFCFFNIFNLPIIIFNIDEFNVFWLYYVHSAAEKILPITFSAFFSAEEDLYLGLNEHDSLIWIKSGNIAKF